MKNLLLPALALALTACTPTLQNASAWVSPSAVELRRGASTEVSLILVDRAGRNGMYSVPAYPKTAGGVRVALIGSGMVNGNSGTIRYRVSAAHSAELGKHTFDLTLTGEGGQLTQTLTVNVLPYAP